MNDIKSYKERIFSINLNEFEDSALELFKFQAEYNPVYQQYIKSLRINPEKVNNTHDIPFMPIQLFRYYKVKTAEWQEEKIFQSSGTTSENASRHFIESLDFYNSVSETIFNKFYGSLNRFIFLGLLPSYLERENSSLIYMLDHFIKKSACNDSGFYLNNIDELSGKIRHIKDHSRRKIILWGVTYALLDFAEKYPMDLGDLIVLETGGMKGRREEIIREEVHEFLIRHLHVKSVHSEYGMTELLSQAYSSGYGLFRCPPWMKIYLREINDPFSIDERLKYGAINIIDLANIHSCAFIETGDLGKLHENGDFEVIGRLDNSDIRGCNLLIN